MAAEPNQLYYVGRCRICRTGPLGVLRCGGCGSLVLLCDECDSVWPDARVEGAPQPASGDDLPCPSCEASLLDDGCWAGEDQIAVCDWLSAALASGQFQLRQGAAFAPQRNLDLP